MRAIIQRVKAASVSVDGSIVSQIGCGLLVLVGISSRDTAEDLSYISRKILNTRIFPNEDGSRRWDKSVKDLNFDVLCVSQFTLYGELKGNKLDFHRAMDPKQSEVMYSDFIKRLGEAYAPNKIHDGVFGAKMDVHLINDGPVTISLDSSVRKSNGANDNDID